MDALQFAYWLQGFAELHGETPPTKAQWKSMREHLDLVFVKVTPPVGLPGVLRKTGPLDQIAPQIVKDAWWLRSPQCSSAVNPLANQTQSVC